MGKTYQKIWFKFFIWPILKTEKDSIRIGVIIRGLSLSDRLMRL